ncbi:MAG: hypothetical protein K6F84_00820 [Lachnospiraceae bacterium]|nr:hypothetical protein [Lachnospiraceae bacterium]
MQISDEGIARIKEILIRLLKALILGLIPLGCAISYCAIKGGSLSRVYLPSSDLNDELFYYKQVEALVNGGIPKGYFGFNESRALSLSFAAWSPVLLLPWTLIGLVFGWGIMTPVITNILFICLGVGVFVFLADPDHKSMFVLGVLLVLNVPNTRYMLSGMSESLCVFMALVYMGAAFMYLKSKKKDCPVFLFVWSFIMTLMRPYFLLFMLFPAFLTAVRYKKKGALLSVFPVMGGLTGYALLKHFFGAAYFTPLFSADWITGFVKYGPFTGLKGLLSRFYYFFKNMVDHMTEGVRSGYFSGAVIDVYVIMLIIIALSFVMDIFKYRYWKKLNETGVEPSGRMKAEDALKLLKGKNKDTIEKVKARLFYEGFGIFSFIAMIAAVIMMYKIYEGSRHLVVFLMVGSCIIALMDTSGFKKASIVAVSLLFFFGIKGPGHAEYELKFKAPDDDARLAKMSQVFNDNLKVDYTEAPNYDNVVIWTVNDSFTDTETGKETITVTDWTRLYALPSGFGISCCQKDYIMENIKGDEITLKSKYIACPEEGDIESLLEEKGFEPIAHDKDFKLYKLR